MSPQVALCISLGVIAWLFFTDMRWRGGSAALFVPWLWLIIVGSRPLGYWLGMTAQSHMQGSAFDRLVGQLLILAAAFVLVRRRIDWLAFISDNKALLSTFLYLLVSTSWSYDPSVSVTRWIRAFSGLLMALVLLTEERPIESIRMVFVRCAYVLFPLSVVTAKYFPEVGRLLSKSWENMITGLALHKNELGLVVLVFGLMVIWDFLEMRRQRTADRKSPLLLNHVLILFCAGWLLVMSNSQTARICMLVAVIGLWGSGRLVNMHHPRRVLILSSAAALCLVAVVQVSGLSDNFLTALGRDRTLTGRTDVWQALAEQHVDPLSGSGFYTFWDAPHTPGAIDGYIASGFKTAHNGYLEMKLDGGLLGVALLMVVLASGAVRVAKRLLEGSLWGRICFLFVILVLPYNWSESAFFRDNPIWFAFLLVTIQCQERLPPMLRVSQSHSRRSKPLSFEAGSASHPTSSLARHRWSSRHVETQHLSSPSIRPLP